MKIKVMTTVLITLFIVSCLIGCTQPGSANTSITSSSARENSTINIPVLSADVSDSDTNTAWSESDTQITLNGSSISVSGIGVAVDSCVATITKEGTYVISGTLTDGQIIVEAANTDKVHIVLNGANITNTIGAPIYAPQCEKLIITLAEGTENSLTDGGSNFRYADTAEEEPNATLFCKDNLSINGTGSLVVNADFNNGIGSKDNLLIISGSITINAANHGLRGNDSVTFLDGNLNIEAGNDGIHTNGNITIDGGSFTILSSDDGIHADGDLTINAGTVNVLEAYEGIEAANIFITGGTIDLVTFDDALNAAGGADQIEGNGKLEQDNFAVGSAYSIVISGGSITFFAGGDGIDSNGTLDISGGMITAIINSSADNGALDSDGATTFTGGTIIYGGTGIGSVPSSSSTQSYVFVNSEMTTGKEIMVKKDGKTLISVTPTADCQYLALSSPDIKTDESYEIYSGDELISTTTAGTAGGMVMGRPDRIGGPGRGDDFEGRGGPREMNEAGNLGQPNE